MSATKRERRRPLDRATPLIPLGGGTLFRGAYLRRPLLIGVTGIRVPPIPGMTPPRGMYTSPPIARPPPRRIPPPPRGSQWSSSPTIPPRITAPKMPPRTEPLPFPGIGCAPG